MKTSASARSSQCRNSRSGRPEPQTVDAAGARDLRLVELAQQRRQDVRAVQVVVVAGAVEVRGHRRDAVTPVLPAIGLAQLDAGDLGDGVPFVGRFQRAGQQRCPRESAAAPCFGIDAGRAEEQQAFDAGLVGGVDDVGLDHQVVVEEIGRERVVGLDPADLCGGHDDDVGPLVRPSRRRTAAWSVRSRVSRPAVMISQFSAAGGGPRRRRPSPVPGDHVSLRDRSHAIRSILARLSDRLQLSMLTGSSIPCDFSRAKRRAEVRSLATISRHIS